MQLLLGSLALILNAVGYFPYIRDILKKKIKPHRITWGVWTILTSIAAFNQVLNGGGYSSLFFISTAFLVTTTFILSIRYGMGGSSKIDRLCIILAIFLLIYWITLKETHISTVVAVVIDGLGAIPTVIKTYRQPHTETYIQWSLAGIAGLCTMFSTPRLDWILLIYPLYVVLINTTIVAVKYMREKN